LGLYAKTLVLPGENIRDWEELLAEVLEDLNPQGAIAYRLAVEIAACLWRLRRIDAAEYASLNRLAQLQVMDRKFEIRDSVASISGKKVRSDAEIDELLKKHAKELHPTAEDLSNALRTMIESDIDVSEKADRRRRALRKEMLELLEALHTMQERRLPPEGSVHDSERPAGGPVLSNDGAQVVPFRTGGSFPSASSGEASVDDAMSTTKPDELKREAVKLDRDVAHQHP
jgi:hypothetical protein